MDDTVKKLNPIDLFDPEIYSIETLEDEIRVDKFCKELLKLYHQYLLKNMSFSPLEAGRMASGADYYLRDYMIDNRRINIFKISPELIHSFAGNWYIINTLNPNMTELESILVGASNFYRFCAEKQLIDPAVAEKVSLACSRPDYYQQRIESFNDLSGDGFSAWNNSCPLQ
ncbi:MAG: hypothetical protein PF441_09560 [Desulfuromusa sp.]|jgi:hypothetical protein|nr:hypothetical protein [Desulfuromusa sp.]